MNTKVYLRKKKLSKGRVSLFFDFYPPIRIPDTNKMTRRYFLGIHLPEKPKNFAEREQVKSIMAKVEIMRLRVLEQLINEKYDFYDKVIEKTDFLAYFHKEALKHNKKWLFVYQHFASFTKNKCTFADVNVALCERFRQYLMNTTKLKDKKVKLKQNSAAGYFSTFRGMLKDTYKRRLLKENINDFLDRIPEEETEIEYLTLEELNLVINSECSFPVLRKAFIFSCITGMRRSDVLSLQWSDIKQLPKGGWYINKRMIKTKSLAKKDIHYHCTRHTCATLSLALGTDIITIKHILGHKQESTTMRYTKVVNPLMEQAAKRLNISAIAQNHEMDKEVKS